MKSQEKALVEGTFDRGISSVEKMFKVLTTYLVNKVINNMSRVIDKRDVGVVV